MRNQGLFAYAALNERMYIMKRLEELSHALVLSENEIDEILTAAGWPAVIDAIAETFIEEANGRTISPPKVIMQIEKFNNDYRVMPSYMLKYPEYCGSKIVSACPDNPQAHTLPLAMATYILNDAVTQTTLMVAGARAITAWRTAAASAVAIRELMPKKDKLNLGIIGCGHQAYFHIPAITTACPIGKVFVTSRTDRSIAKLLNHFRPYPWTAKTMAKSNTEEIFEMCDIVAVMTPTTEPHIFLEDIPDREIVIAGVGGDSDRKIELDPRIIGVADHYCDSYEQVSHTGIVMRALEEKIITRDDLKSVGDHMIGKKESDDSKKVKLFISTGVALEDLALAVLVYRNHRLVNGG